MPRNYSDTNLSRSSNFDTKSSLLIERTKKNLGRVRADSAIGEGKQKAARYKEENRERENKIRREN